MTIDILDDPSPESGHMGSYLPQFPFFPFFPFFPVRLGRRWGMAACLLAAAFALMLGAGTAQAQTATEVGLVSNIGQTDDGTASFANDLAGSFTTGSNAGGYLLSGVTFDIASTGTAPTFTVKVHENNSSDRPGDSIGTLTQQGNLPSSSSAVRFDAGAPGIELDHSKTYWVVIDVTANATGNTTLKRTSSNDENSGGEAGWSIGDSRLWRVATGTTWSTESSNVLQLTVHGSVTPTDLPVTGAVTDDTLTLTFNKAVKLGADLGVGTPPPPRALIPYMTVKVAGRKVAVTGVALSGKTVTLTLDRPVGRNQAVTVSYNNAGGLLRDQADNLVASFTDLTVENLSTNDAPVFTGTDPSPPDADPRDAPPGTLIFQTVGLNDFTDDDDPRANLTLSFSVDRDNVLQTGDQEGPLGLSWFDGALYFQMKTDCSLKNVKPALPTSFVTVVTVTATDPTGAAGHVDIRLTTDTGNACPELTAAAVTDRTLTLTYEGSGDGMGGHGKVLSGLSASDFEVTVAGHVVPLADTDPVTIGEPTTSGGTTTTPVTLMLAQAVGAGQDVKASHTPGDDPSTVGFTDRAVTVGSTNRAPTVAGVANAMVTRNAPPGIRVSVPVEDADSDVFPADHPSAGLKLHVTWTTDRPDLFTDENALYNDHTGQFNLVTPGECELAQVESPPPTGTFDTTVEITATDPIGAVARGTVTAKTTWGGGVECPALTGAVVNGATLTLFYSQDLDEDSTPPKDRFTVKSGGTAVDLASSDAVAVTGNRVVLTLAEEIPAGRRVTVSYRPPFFGGIGRYVGTFPTGVQYDALELTDEPVANVAGDTRRPQLQGEGAWVEGNVLTLVYDELLHPDHKADPGNYDVEEVHDNGSNRIHVDTNEVIGKRVVLTLRRAVNTNRRVVLTYSPVHITGTPLLIQDFAGNRVSGIFEPLPVIQGPPPPVGESSPPPPPGGGGPSGGGGSPGDTAPDFGSARVAPLTLARGEAMDPVVLPQATGGDGELTYTLASAPAGLAGLTFNAATRRLSGTPDTAGEYGFTYTVHDADANRADSDAAVLTFTVTVEDPRTAQVRQSVRRTLAAVARRSLTSALDNIGARFAASVPGPSLTLAGETVPLGAIAGSGGTERFCSPGSPGATDGFGTDGENCAFVTRGMTGEELMHASSFTLTLGAAGSSENTGTGAPPSPRWAVWGRGDLGTFAGHPEPGMGYEGELRTGWLGVDARSGAWVAGLALSHGTGEADYDFAAGGVSGQGRLETSLTALYPYGRWTLSEGLELRGVLGAGSGEARHRLDGDAGERSDLSMWMGSVGLRREFPSLGEIDLAARADASLARMETDDGPAHIANLSADSWRLRAGLEASRRFALDGDAALEPFVEAAARRDGGDGLEGTGLEIAGGVRYTAPRLHVEMRGRWLASHSEEGAEESGVSVTARLGPGAQGRGLSLSLSPRWGAGTGGAEALWRDELPGPAGSGGAAAMDARIGYGFSWAPYGLDGMNGLLTPFAETGISGEDSRRLRLGARFEASRTNLGIELAGERRENGANEPEHAIRLDLGLRF